MGKQKVQKFEKKKRHQWVVERELIDCLFKMFAFFFLVLIDLAQ